MLPEGILKERRGNITASTAHAIMVGWDKPRPAAEYPAPIYDWIAANETKPAVGQIKDEMECDVSAKLIDAAWKAYQYDRPSQGLITYAEGLACEQLFDNDPSLERTTQHMINGNERELEGMEMLAEATGLDFVNLGENQIHLFADGIGATPDGLVYDDLDLIMTGGEIKCRSPLHHMRELAIVDNATLIKHDFPRFCQIQVGCMVAEVDHWYSASFHPFARLDAHRFHYCIIQRDDVFLDIFRKRAALAFHYKQAFIDEHTPAKYL